MEVMEDHPLNWIEAELKQLDAASLRRSLETHAGPQGATIEVAGRRLINFGSNDYLGLAADPRLAHAAVEAAKREGWGSGASPLVTGRSPSHQQLEKRLADFEDAEAALLFSTGFAANMGTIASLVGRGDLILSDERNHASIIDGCRLSRAEVFIYPHRDAGAVAKRLKASRGFRRRLIVTDSLFSMDGDCAPLPELAELAEQYKTMLMVDEAHASGVFGERGRDCASIVAWKKQSPCELARLARGLAQWAVSLWDRGD
jgi:7-keto-8-aminopelargonate synthetase-like enzyme